MIQQIKLRDGSITKDPRLDRIVQFDKNSRKYPIRTLLADKKPRSYTWRINSWLDQGREGACVGYGCNHEINGKPVEHNIDIAMYIYREAQKIDPWPGEGYSGTSVLAGVKIMQKLGYIKEYRWAFGESDLRLSVGYAGTAIIGVNWYTGMFRPSSDGFLRPTGRVEGGHCIVVNGVSLKKQAYRVHNSWGKDWGDNGEAWIRFEDMDRLLREDGEAVIMVGRKKVKEK